MIEQLEHEWLREIEGMTFFDEPVSGLPRERLLLLIGMLVSEKRRLEDESRRHLMMWKVRP